MGRKIIIKLKEVIHKESTIEIGNGITQEEADVLMGRGKDSELYNKSKTEEEVIAEFISRVSSVKGKTLSKNDAKLLIDLVKDITHSEISKDEYQFMKKFMESAEIISETYKDVTVSDVGYNS